MGNVGQLFRAGGCGTNEFEPLSHPRFFLLGTGPEKAPGAGCYVRFDVRREAKLFLTERRGLVRENLAEGG